LLKSAQFANTRAAAIRMALLKSVTTIRDAGASFLRISGKKDIIIDASYFADIIWKQGKY